MGILGAGVGFVAADWLDRYLATYNPAGDPDKAPKNKFTSDGAGTLANALNVASPPHLVRIGAAVGSVVVPAFVAMYVKNPMARRSLEGIALGAGVKAFSMLWSNVLMPMLAPKGDKATPEALQKNMIARLYPAEVAAKLNLETKTEAVTSAGSGALSAPPPDVGPFALAGSSPYPDAAQALRRQAGLDGDSPYPSASQALREKTGVLRDGDKSAGNLAYGRPAPPNRAIAQWRGAHPGYQRGGNNVAAQWSQRWGNNYQAGYAIPASPTSVGPSHHHHHCMLRAKAAYPSYTDQQLHAWCLARPHHTHPYLYEAPVQNPTTGVISDSADGDPGAPPSPDAGGPGFVPAGPPPAPQAPTAMAPPDPVGPPTFNAGPGVGPGPGPIPLSQECGCVGESNQFLGFIGDQEEKDIFFNTGK
jgi:hypothetical protein